MTTATKARTDFAVPPIDSHTAVAAAQATLDRLITIRQSLEREINNLHGDLKAIQDRNLDDQADALIRGENLDRHARTTAIKILEDRQHDLSVARRAGQRAERDLERAEVAAAKAIAPQVRQQEAAHVRKITKAIDALRDAVADQRELHESLRLNGYEQVSIFDLQAIPTAVICNGSDHLDSDILFHWQREAERVFND